MIRLTYDVVLEIEDAARLSLLKHGKAWRVLSPEELEARLEVAMDNLQRYNDIPVEQILTGIFLKPTESADIALPEQRTTTEFLNLVVTVATVRSLLVTYTPTSPPTLRVV